MLTAEQNELLTRIGPGTPCGDLMRRYWHPIAAVSELDGKWNKRVRLLGEDLVLFKDRQGRFGLITEACPHRRASLALRHSDQRRHPLPLPRLGVRPRRAMPRAAERAGEERVPHKVETPAYAVEEMGGMFWAYLGPPESKPLLPRIDGFVSGRHDPHARQRAHSVQLAPDHGELARPGPHRMAARPHLRVHQGAEGPGATRSRSARTTRRSRSASSSTASPSTACSPATPRTATTGRSATRSCSRTFCRSATATRSTRATTRSRSACRWTTPTPCTSGTPPTCRRRARRSPPHLLDKVYAYDVPLPDKNGDYILDNIDGQDIMVWCTQGADRRPHQGEPRRLRQRHRTFPPRAPPRDQEGRGGRRPDVHLPRRRRATAASTCRTSARSTTTATACEAGSCARTPPTRRSPTRCAESSRRRSRRPRRCGS